MPTHKKRKPTAFNFKTYDARHRKQMLQRGAKVQQLFEKAIKELTQRAANSPLGSQDPETEFKWSDYPGLEKECDALMKELEEGLQLNLDNGMNDAWALSNAKNDALLASLASRVNIPKADMATWKERHLEALDALTNRIKNGMNLSDGSGDMVGVWNLQQFKGELELSLQTCMGRGMSAVEMTKEVKQYLKYPNKLFRRVRDENGVLRLSKAAKNFHPGRGVYRSSYKNALRLTATENNIAYRTADNERWGKMQFVMGIHVLLSNNHPVEDICDMLSGKDEEDLRGRYPKDFKFTGWHPWCRCFAIPLLPDEDEFAEYMERKSNGEDMSDFEFPGTRKEMPQEFNDWCEANSDRIQRAAGRGKLPYFIKDNKTKVEKAIGEKIKDIIH